MFCNPFLIFCTYIYNLIFVYDYLSSRSYGLDSIDRELSNLFINLMLSFSSNYNGMLYQK